MYCKGVLKSRWSCGQYGVDLNSFAVPVVAMDRRLQFLGESLFAIANIHIAICFMSVPYPDIHNLSLIDSANYVDMVEMLLHYMCMVPPLPPNVPPFKILMGFPLAHQINYPGRDVLTDLYKAPERFWRLTSK